MSKPVVPWMGGKTRLLKHILPIIPDHQTYVEPFAGGAAVFFNKSESKVEVINDAHGDLINLYRVLKHHLDEFVRQFKWALISRQQFLWHLEESPETLTDIQRAARFYYMQRTNFGGKVDGTTFGIAATAPPAFNLLRMEEELSAAHLRLARVYIERLDWAECVARYDRPGTFFYLDPPYWKVAGYGVKFEWSNYQRMAELAQSIQGKMLISINDHPDIRRNFKGLRMKSIGINYTVGGTHKGKNRKELLIRAY